MSIEEIKINPMHKEMLTDLGNIVDKYSGDGMPAVDSIGVLCQCVGLLIGFSVPPAQHSIAVLACVKNIGEGIGK